MKSTGYIASVAVGAVLAASQVASAHPGHEGHGLAPQAPWGTFALVMLGVHAVAAGVWMLKTRVQKKRR